MIYLVPPPHVFCGCNVAKILGGEAVPVLRKQFRSRWLLILFLREICFKLSVWRKGIQESTWESRSHTGGLFGCLLLKYGLLRWRWWERTLPLMQETWEIWVWSLDGEDPLGWEDLQEKGMATHSSMLAWKIPWTEEPDGEHTIGSHRVGRVAHHSKKCYILIKHSCFILDFSK